MEVTINGQEMSADEAQRFLSKETVRIDSVTISHENPNKDTPITMEGFDIPKEYLVSLVNKMEMCGASEAKVNLDCCRKLGGRDIILIIKNRKEL